MSAECVKNLRGNRTSSLQGESLAMAPGDVVGPSEAQRRDRAEPGKGKTCPMVGATTEKAIKKVCRRGQGLVVSSTCCSGRIPPCREHSSFPQDAGSQEFCSESKALRGDQARARQSGREAGVEETVQAESQRMS